MHLHDFRRARHSRRPRRIIGIFYGTLCCLVLAGSSASALDQIRTARGTQSGTIESLSPTEIKLSRSGRSESIPVNEVVVVRFDGEPPQLNVARNAAINGRYEDALREFEKLATEVQGQSREEIKQDLAFYQAYCTAKLALGGMGDAQAAGRTMSDFLNKNKQSYHFYTANEVLGDLLVAINRNDVAMKYYEELAKAPWTDYQMRAAIAKGRALLAQENFSQAQAEFTAALELGKNAQGPLIDAQRSAATLGLADGLARNGQTDEAIKLVEDIIRAAHPEAVELHARAYNTLGNCYRRAGRPKDAIWAFLHVEELYASSPREHAEALWNLSQLWDEVKQPEHAVAAREKLQQMYAGSTWTQK